MPCRKTTSGPEHRSKSWICSDKQPHALNQTGLLPKFLPRYKDIYRLSIFHCLITPEPWKTHCLSFPKQQGVPSDWYRLKTNLGSPEDTPSTCVDCTKTVNCYLKKQDWRVRNMSAEMVSEVSLLQFKGGRDARNHILKGYQNSSYTGGNLHRESSILCKYPLSWSSHPTCFTKISYIQTFGSLSELPTKTNTVYEYRAAGCKGRMPRDKDKECP